MNWIPKMMVWKNLSPFGNMAFWAYMLKFLGCLTVLLFIFLEWRDVLDNVNVGINHPYINWIVRFGISISSIESGNYQSLHQSSSNLPNSNLGASTTLNWNQSKFDISWSNATSPECHGVFPGNRVALLYKGFLDPPACVVVGVGKWVGHAPGPVEAGTYAAKGGARTGPPWSTEESGEGAVPAGWVFGIRGGKTPCFFWGGNENSRRVGV